MVSLSDAEIESLWSYYCPDGEEKINKAIVCTVIRDVCEAYDYYFTTYDQEVAVVP